jgi:hypothetical protein
MGDVVRLSGNFVVVGTRAVIPFLLSDSASIPLQKSVVQMQARMLSDSTGIGEHSGVGSTGSSMLPNRMLVGKHSRITAFSEFDLVHE